MAVSIFKYLDYRLYLQELYSSLKKEAGNLSLRAFARMAGSTSPNFLKLITDRVLRINDKQMSTLATAVSLTQKEQEYFKAIIDFDHGKSHTDKNRAFLDIVRLRQYKSVSTMDDRQYRFLSEWYNPVIKELVCCSCYPDEPQWLTDKIVPTVGLREIKKGIKLLEELNLIKRNAEDNGWDANEVALATPSEVHSIAVVEYHRNMLKRAADSMELFPSAERDIRAITLGIPKERFPELKERLTAFWNELLSMSEEIADPEMVVQLNTQLFPLTISEAHND